MEITVFGKPVLVNDLVCGSFGGPHVPVVDPYVNLYVRMTNLCQARCPFCESHGDDSRMFDHNGFRRALYEIHSKAYIKKLAITGGEPTLRIGDLAEVVRSVKELDSGILVDLNTNGYRLEYLDDETLENLGSICLSRHHWDDSVNATTFGKSVSPFSTEALTRFLEHAHKIQLRCNLIRGFVDSRETVLEYMRVMSRYRVSDYGFVALMPMNSYCRRYLVTPQEIGLMEPLPGALATKHWDSPRGSCSCRNFIIDVLDNGLPVRYYTRYESKPETCVASSLVWDVDCLRTGFGGPVIWQAG